MNRPGEIGRYNSDATILQGDPGVFGQRRWSRDGSDGLEHGERLMVSRFTSEAEQTEGKKRWLEVEKSFEGSE